MDSEERFITPEPLPTDYEREILTILVEECSEVIQRATKMQRFGVHEVQPGQYLMNVDRLSLEVGDLLMMIDKAKAAGLLVDYSIENGMARKERQLKRFMQSPGPSEPTIGADDPDMPDLSLCSFNYLAEELRKRGATVTPAPHGGDEEAG